LRVSALVERDVAALALSAAARDCPFRETAFNADETLSLETAAKTHLAALSPSRRETEN